MRALGTVLVATVLLVGCSGSQTPDGGDKDIAGLACDHFRNISSDAAAGLLTDGELREKLKEVYSNSAGAGNAIRAAASRMLSEITGGNLTSDAVFEMDEACTAAGH